MEGLLPAGELLMTLSQMAGLVCRKIGKTDSVSVAACKDFIRQRHELIYDSALWVESRDYASFPYPSTEDGLRAAIRPGQPEYVARVILPSNVGLLLQLRCGGDWLSPEQASSAFGRDPDAFAATGLPVSFVEEGSSGVSWPLPDLPGVAGSRLCFQITNPEDSGIQVTVRGIRPVTVGGVPIPSTLVEEETVALTASQTYTTQHYLRVESLSKPPSLGKVTLTSPELNGERSDEWGAEETERRHVVCRILRRPNFDPTHPQMLHACFKRKIQPLAGDGDIPMVRGIDNVLLAFAQADMLERGRQYSKAQLKAQEAAALLQVAVDLQTGQGASLVQIQPETGSTSGTRDDFAW